MFLEPDPYAVKQTIDAVLLPAFVVDNAKDGFRVIAINESHETVSGMINETTAGKTPEDLLSKPDARQVIAQYRKCVETGEPIQYSETLEMPHGRINWLTSLIPIKNADGETTRLLGNAVGYLDATDGTTNPTLVGEMTQLSLMSALPLHMAIEAISQRLRSDAENVDDTLLLKAVKDLCGTALEASRKMRDLVAATTEPKEINALLKDDRFRELLKKLKD